ncbi:hypothetical protein JCM11491_005517 [Sporobolomyces phaffii]
MDGRSINAVYSIPHACQVHSFATTNSPAHLYTGGQDGFVRRYNLAATLTPSADPPPNLTMKQQQHLGPPPLVPAAGTPVLAGYWENEDPPPANSSEPDPPKWGTKATANAPQSAVYSLAVNSTELWGLSGTSKGSINLFTIRHDQGQIRHVFKPDLTPPSSSSSSSSSPRGHAPTSPVSVLTLDRAEKSFLSGGWDGRIFDWDLDTGKVKQAFLSNGSRRQISSISYRPTSATATTTPKGQSSVPPSSSTTTTVTEDQDAEGEPDEDVEMDADGEVDDTLAPPASSSLPAAPLEDPADTIPLVGGPPPPGDDDVFLSTSLDGLVLVWDKRIGAASSSASASGSSSSTTPRGVVHKFDDFGNELDRLGLGGGGPPAAPAPADADSVPRKRSTAARGRDKWSTAACWSPSGDKVYVARHASVFSCYDLRRGGTGAGAGAAAEPVATYALPRSTGPITTIRALATTGGNAVVTGSWDCVRVWDLDRARPFERGERRRLLSSSSSSAAGGVRVVGGGHYGGTLSSLHVDPSEQWMFTTSGTRGWDGNATENLIIHEIVKT